MMTSLGKRTYEVLNKQITEELASSYLYMSMSAVLSDMGLEGCASWMMKQAEEEYQHAMRIFHHLLVRGVKVKLLPIPASKQEWRAPLHIFEEMQRHEQKVTSLIYAIYEAAVADKDYASMAFIQWFIDDPIVHQTPRQLRNLSFDKCSLQFDIRGCDGYWFGWTVRIQFTRNQCRNEESQRFSRPDLRLIDRDKVVRQSSVHLFCQSDLFFPNRISVVR